MQLSPTFLSLFVVLAAPATRALCCIEGTPTCTTFAKSPVENGIFNADIWVPEGAKNVLTNATLNKLENIICCCTAISAAACSTTCLP
ncbi:hypothetical protein EXIGLDRAFT_779707 [Exidia glandulosa HHB12029]|uniref:Hydrophobin n=1 Tax=Exidia glandulosa HHB12029 TaxID=1314781 RepID=A0A165ZCK9_EXIGL|nr:hypothetical protein EXIGLDRAFT_779707 [Exidia glandulosa HHB12029]